MSAISQSARHASPACVLIADDLTGACDAGVWFARNGLLTRVALGRAPARDCDVLVVSTDSRRFTAPVAAEQVRVAVGMVPLLGSVLVFKKIDSTFRGHIAAECDSLMKLAGAPYGVIIPAVPSQGRTVEHGMLFVQDVSGNWSLDIRDVLRQQGVAVSTISPRKSGTAQDLATVIMQAAASTAYVLCDAANEQDLALAAEALLSIPARPLWIGASGLAREAARLLRSRAEYRTPRSFVAAAGPVVLCVGSNHQVTLTQLERVQQVFGGTVVQAAGSAAGEIGRTAGGKGPLVLAVDTSSESLIELKVLIEEIRSCSPAAILVTGGDTAALLCRAAEAKELVLEDEVVCGVPAGYIEGGLLDGVKLATKSGGFGGVDCLVDCIRRLSSSVMTGAR